MAKSQQSWNKKEKEKQKRKKREEKVKKREERKTLSAESGSTLDDMIAYVDEFGNITSEPPDPTRKKEIVKAADIELGIPKKEKEDYITERVGKVTFFNDSKGYGFIRDHDSQESVFVHVNNLVDDVRENDKVNFEVEQGPKGLNAVNVRLVK